SAFCHCCIDPFHDACRESARRDYLGSAASAEDFSSPRTLRPPNSSEWKFPRSRVHTLWSASGRELSPSEGAVSPPRHER
ncbi:MAG TPA: hypothetical protein VHL59_05655, partial [Thermoanaerobaculia bacterium]|nr:hypothetical protein [Thermoanaerobaculia bacterium]